ncbi:hypothetical protein [Paenibacillus agricola]|uniref:Uncharacterized protein n=1 Tax=Paenibacillus agricola TaxID=2716264 RepID=A0ABX0J4G6_9BACL|nr:hypothetical protein [Paenibacillus agricola]NHN31220.1 hypothetical protein [Paenibacillus agricola]
MFNSNQILSSSVDFDNAMFLGSNIEVYQDGEPIDRGGQILKHTDDCVFIGDGYFIKETCGFKGR